MIIIIIKLIKKLIYAFLLLFSLNISLKSFGIYFPINYANIILTTLLGLPGLLSIFIVKLLMF